MSLTGCSGRRFAAAEPERYANFESGIIRFSAQFPNKT